MKWFVKFMKNYPQETSLMPGDRMSYKSDTRGSGFILFERGNDYIYTARNTIGQDPRTLTGFVHCVNQEQFLFIAELIAAAAGMGIEFEPEEDTHALFSCTLIARP